MQTDYSTRRPPEIESIHLVWLDATALQSDASIKTQNEFQMVIENFRAFTTIESCQNYINDKTIYDRIFLIVSGRLGQEIMPTIHDLRQISYIYVYCGDKERNETWANKYFKIRGVIIDLYLLIRNIKHDYNKYMISKIDEPFSMNISKINNLSNKIIPQEFLYSQLIIDCLLQVNIIEADKTDFIQLCSKEYSSTNSQKLIQEFGLTYTSNQTLEWYLRDSFIYRILNKALCLKNLDLLFCFGFFIGDMYENLLKHKSNSSTQAFRSQIITPIELHELKNSIGHFMCINTFILANTNLKSALTLVDGYQVGNDLVRVLFEIKIDGKGNHSKPYATVTNSLNSSQETQILFMAGSVFQIFDVKHDKKSGIWYVNLTLSNVTKEYDDKDPIECGMLLQKLRKWNQAEKYFIRLLKKPQSNDQFISKCYQALGLITFLNGNYDYSLIYYQHILNAIKSNNPLFAEIYYSIGCVYHKKNNFQEAMDYYSKALDSWKRNFGNDEPIQVAACLNNMGCIYEDENIYAKGLECHEKALALRLKYNVDIGSSYNNIGNIYLSVKDYNRALTYYLDAYYAKSKYLSESDPSLLETLRNIGLAYECDANYTDAFSYYKRVASHYEKLYPQNDRHNVEIQNDVQRISDILNRRT